MPQKVHFDKELSMKLCPPKNPTDKHGKQIGRWVKRVILDRSLVSFNIDENPRVHNIKPENVVKIRDSFEVNGWIITEQPSGIMVDPQDKSRFVGLSGFNRNEAASALEWTHMIYDVYEFDTPLNIRKFRSISNHHNTPHADMTKADIIKEVVAAIRSKEIPNEEGAIEELVDILAADKTDNVKKTIFKNVIQAQGGSDNIRAYHNSKGENSLEKVAIQLNLPWKGDARFSQTGKLGYIISNDTQKTTLFDAKKLSREYNWKNVEFRAHIEEPKETPAIYAQRETWEKNYKDFLRTDAEFVQAVMARCGFKCDIDTILKNYPFTFNGFVPQVITPDEKKGGAPTEETVVNWQGKPI